jgi:4-oxalocrotonate tautomerase
MPVIRVSSFPQSWETRKALAEEITEAVHRRTQVPKENIWVIFDPVPQENWAVAGRLLSEK